MTRNELKSIPPFIRENEDVVLVESWKKQFINLDISSSVKLQECYKHYSNFITESHGRIPLSKRKFSEVFRVLMSDSIIAGQIKINDRSKVTFLGVKLVN